MIINFELTKSELDEIDSSYNSEFDYLVNKIIQTSIDGIHLIRISEEFFEWIEENISLSSLYSEHLLGLMEDLTYQDKLIDDAKVILNVRLHGKLTLSSDGKNWNIGFSSIIDSDYLNKPAVVVENIKYDGGVYDKIFKKMEDEIKKTHESVNFTYTFYHGGGGDSADLLEYLIGEHKVIVCICDSDQKVPEVFAESETYTELLSLKQKCEKKELARRYEPPEQVRCFVGDIFATPGHELENIFMIEMWEEICANKKMFEEKRGDFNKLININWNTNKKHFVYLYYDFMKGVSIEKFVKLFDIEKYIDKNIEYYESIFYYSDRKVVKIDFRNQNSNQIINIYESENFSSLKSSDLMKKEIKINKSKFDWYLDMYNLDLSNLHNFKLEFQYKNIVGDFLKIKDESLQDHILTKHMSTDYWQVYYKEWFTSLSWYFISGEFQSN